MRQLTSKMSIFSSFEMAMAALGTVLSRGSSYWTSYLGASVVEWVENKATSDEDKLMPKPITQLFAWLCQLWKVKDNQGEALTWEKALSQGLREKVIGTFNASLSIVTAAHALFRPLINFLSQNDEEERPGPFTHFCKTVLPVFNTMLMWASSSAKLRLAHAVSGLKKPTDLVEPMDLCGHANSGREDAVCGMESAGLMLGHLISSFNAPLGKLYDTALGLWVAFNSFRNGQTGMKGTAEEGPNTEDLRARYPLGFLQQGAVGDFFYKIVHRLCSWMKLELPNPSEISGLLTKDVA